MRENTHIATHANGDAGLQCSSKACSLGLYPRRLRVNSFFPACVLACSIASRQGRAQSHAGSFHGGKSLGGALIAIPMARLMAQRGRRPGLVMGYGLGIVGAVLLIVAGVVGLKLAH